MAESPKCLHTIVLDAGPLLTHEPAISTLLAKAEKLYTVPTVIAEIKDRDARARLETTIAPFLTVRIPSPVSIKVVSDFSRKSGDLSVLSTADLHILALAYELECERNHGDWRLRSSPGQKRLNGSPPKRLDDTTKPAPEEELDAPKDPVPSSQPSSISGISLGVTSQGPEVAKPDVPADVSAVVSVPVDATKGLGDEADNSEAALEPALATTESAREDSDDEGWITATNLTKHQANRQSEPTESEPKIIQVATITGDYAMQNVLLQMNLNLLSTSLLRIRHLKSYVLRCHACFQVSKDMTKQFCQRCGGPTLTRVACSTDANGEFHLHLKKNMQWNTRGNRFSIPKPVAGTSNGKAAALKGGGKGGWGQELILAEDQKEYVRAVAGQARRKERNLMDQDFLPAILTGERSGNGGRPRIGAGRNVNSKKR